MRHAISCSAYDAHVNSTRIDERAGAPETGREHSRSGKYPHRGTVHTVVDNNIIYVRRGASSCIIQYYCHYYKYHNDRSAVRLPMNTNNSRSCATMMSLVLVSFRVYHRFTYGITYAYVRISGYPVSILSP